MKHTRIDMLKYISQELQFTKPFATTSEVDWQFDQTGTGVKVTWGMAGHMPFFFRFMAKKMPAIIGMDYDRGLKMLKDYCETGVVLSKIEIVGVVDAPSITFVGKDVSCKMSETETSMKQELGALMVFAIQNQLKPNVMLSVYRTTDFTGNQCDYSPGMLIPASETIKANGYEKRTIPASKAIKIIFKGDYKFLPNGWAAAYTCARAKKLKPVNLPYELYINNPQETMNPADWVTEIYVPVK